MVSRTCNAVRDDQQPCRAAPLRESGYCLMHDPAHADLVAEGRRLGGSRRRKEATLAVAYDLEPITTIPALRRIVEIVIADALSLDNTAVRGRLLLAAVQVAAKLITDSELAGRVAQLEAVTHVHDGKGRR